MANVHEALQRAEKERQQSRGGAGAAPAGAASVPTVAKRSGKEGKRKVSKAAALEGRDINKRRIALLQPDSFVAEQFRSLRSRIDALATQRPLRTIVVTSAIQGEGKSMSAVNLALVSAMSVEARVLLIDGDLRQPGVAKTFGLTPRAGLAEVLSGSATLDTAISRVEGVNLDVLPVKSVPSNPSELLASNGMKSLIEKLTPVYDRIIIDVPPVLGLPDVKVMSELADGLVLVVRADETPKEEIEAALDVLDRGKVLGMILNGVPDTADRYSYYDK